MCEEKHSHFSRFRFVPRPAHYFNCIEIEITGGCGISHTLLVRGVVVRSTTSKKKKLNATLFPLLHPGHKGGQRGAAGAERAASRGGPAARTETRTRPPRHGHAAPESATLCCRAKPHRRGTNFSSRSKCNPPRRASPLAANSCTGFGTRIGALEAVEVPNPVGSLSFRTRALGNNDVNVPGRLVDRECIHRLH